MAWWWVVSVVPCFVSVRSEAYPHAPEEGGPFLNLIVVFGEYIRVNILIFFISSGGMVEGSSLTPFLHLDKGINQYEGFITYTCCDDIHAHA